MAFELGKRFLQ